MNRAVRSRRRSSNFRPSAYYDMENLGKNGFELLPLMILQMIFAHLNTRDLLSVCRCSRLFYLPAMTQVYENIVVVDDKKLVDFLEGVLGDSALNVGTIMPYANMDKLVATLRGSRKIGSWVRAVRFVAKSSDSFIQMEELAQLVSHTQLVGLYDASLGLNKFNKLIRTKRLTALSKLCICIESEPIEENFSFGLPRLRELMICYRNSDVGAKNIEILAMTLAQNGIMNNLESLEFQEISSKDLSLLNQSNTNMQLAIWINFFTSLRQPKGQPSGHRYTKLANLKLDGFINNTGHAISSLINELFDLRSLQALKVFVKEFSHLHQYHYQNHTSFIKNFIAHCPNLVTLQLDPTFDCLTCQYYNLEETLDTIAVKKILLQNLFLTFELMNLEDCRHIFQALLKKLNAKALLKLKVFDKSNQAHNENAFRKHLGPTEFSQLEQLNYDFQIFTSSLFRYDSTLESNYKLNLILERMLQRFMESNRQSVSEYSDQYLKSIEFDHCAETFPNLKFLSINNIHFVVDKDRQPRLAGAAAATSDGAGQ